MSTSIAGILELSLVFGLLLAFLFWELYSLHRAGKRDAGKRRSGGKDGNS